MTVSPTLACVVPANPAIDGPVRPAGIVQSVVPGLAFSATTHAAWVPAEPFVVAVAVADCVGPTGLVVADEAVLGVGADGDEGVEVQPASTTAAVITPITIAADRLTKLRRRHGRITDAFLPAARRMNRAVVATRFLEEPGDPLTGGSART